MRSVPPMVAAPNCPDSGIPVFGATDILKNFHSYFEFVLTEISRPTKSAAK
jgi:hypothetical protein